jgi:hypothetical protein
MVVRSHLQRPGPLLIGAAALAVALWGAWSWVAYLRGPEYAFQQFIAAIERHDAAAVYAMTLDDEKAEFGVTPEGVARVLDHTVYRHARWVQARPTPLDADFGPQTDGWVIHLTSWADGRTGRIIPSANGAGQLLTTVHLFRSRQGRWQVSLTRFASSYQALNYFRPQLFQGSANWPERRRRALQTREQLLAEMGIDRVLPLPKPTPGADWRRSSA